MRMQVSAMRSGALSLPSLVGWLLLSSTLIGLGELLGGDYDTFFQAEVGAFAAVNIIVAVALILRLGWAWSAACRWLVIGLALDLLAAVTGNVLGAVNAVFAAGLLILLTRPVSRRAFFRPPAR